MKFRTLTFVAHLSVYRGTSAPEQTTECSCPGSASSFDIFNEYITSPSYISSIEDAIIPDTQFRLLLTHFRNGGSGVYSNIVEAILSGTFASADDFVSTAEPPSTLSQPGDLTVSPGETWTIPTSDYIVSNAMDALRQVLDDIGIGAAEEVDVYEVLQTRVNLALFRIHTETDQLSVCEVLGCRAWRAVLKQVSLRTSLSFGQRSWSSASELENELRPILFALVSSPTKPDLEKAILPLLVLIAPVVVQGAVKVTCWCLRSWLRTTTTPEPTTTETPVTTNKNVEMRSMYFLTANAYLDEVTQLMGTAGKDDLTFLQRIVKLRQTISDRVMKITTVVSKLATTGNVVPQFDPSTCIQYAFDVIKSLNEVTSLGEWYRKTSTIHSSLGGIRSELFKFVVPM